ncbi:hypothetical protein BCR35DRAFT_114702 [Leucosporidium creatinivorum]|uniref:Uncharacterized protein n=1 Tax=Leucosporidium creatinivorum TaxID=106004 RepID=A0A1Y2F1A1_9BASI|nr:hypothetical protein BCR35DRAFT_114702 [Leucosporidium creatinivorum]
MQRGTNESAEDYIKRLEAHSVSQQRDTDKFKQAADRAAAEKVAAEKAVEEERKKVEAERKRADDAIAAGKENITEEGLARAIQQSGSLVNRGKMTAEGKIVAGTGGGTIPTNIQIRTGGGLPYPDDLIALAFVQHTLPPCSVMHDAALAEARKRVLDVKSNFTPDPKNPQRLQATLSDYQSRDAGLTMDELRLALTNIVRFLSNTIDGDGSLSDNVNRYMSLLSSHANPRSAFAVIAFHATRWPQIATTLAAHQPIVDLCKVTRQDIKNAGAMLVEGFDIDRILPQPASVGSVLSSCNKQEAAELVEYRKKLAIAQAKGYHLPGAVPKSFLKTHPDAAPSHPPEGMTIPGDTLCSRRESEDSTELRKPMKLGGGGGGSSSSGGRSGSADRGGKGGQSFRQEGNLASAAYAPKEAYGGGGGGGYGRPQQPQQRGYGGGGRVQLWCPFCRQWTTHAAVACPNPVHKGFPRNFSGALCVREDGRFIPICLGFNIEKGCTEDGCTRKHVCASCGKDHSATQCAEQSS